MNNLQLLCMGCNYVKNPRGLIDTCERSKETEIEINRKK